MNFNENDLWRDKKKLLNLRFAKLHSSKVLLKLEFDTKDQVLFLMVIPLGAKLRMFKMEKIWTEADPLGKRLQKLLTFTKRAK